MVRLAFDISSAKLYAHRFKKTIPWVHRIQWYTRAAPGPSHPNVIKGSSTRQTPCCVFFKAWTIALHCQYRCRRCFRRIRSSVWFHFRMKHDGQALRMHVKLLSWKRLGTAAYLITPTSRLSVKPGRLRRSWYGDWQSGRCSLEQRQVVIAYFVCRPCSQRPVGLFLSTAFSSTGYNF